MRRLLLAAALAFSPALGLASDPAKLVTKTFAVADLVVPIPDPTSTAKPTTHDGSLKLMRTVQTIVRPHTWGYNGGPGKLEYFDTDHSLVVTNTQPVIEEVYNLLAGLRKLQETSVVTEVRVVSVPVGFRDWCPVKCADGTLLCEKQTAKFLDFAQAHAKTTIMQAPKVTTFDGQTATVRVGEEKSFVTGVEAVKVNGQPVLVPKNTPAHTGDAMTLCGRVGGDGKSVTLKVNVTRTRLAEKVELVPVTTQITPIFEGGSQGQPVPFTQYVQAPEFKTFTAERTATVPSCGTVVVGGWKESNRAECGPPVLSKIPYMNRLFKNVGIEEREVVVLATTRVVAAPAEPKAEAPACQPASAADAGWPERYSAVARQEVLTPFATQTANGTFHTLTFLNAHFEPGTTTLTPQGVVKLEYLAKTPLTASGCVYLQSANDLPPTNDWVVPRGLIGQRTKLDTGRANVIQQKLMARSVFCRVTLVDVPGDHPTFPADVMPPWGGAEPRTMVAAGEVKMEAMVLQVPAEFMTKIGLAADGVKHSRVWTITARERDMFNAALRNAADVKRLSEPTVVVQDGREATFRVGAYSQIVTGLNVSMKNGDTHVLPKTTTVDCGTAVRVTPHVSADGKFVRLNLKATHVVATEMGRKQAVVVPCEKGEPLTVHVEEMPKQDVQAMEMAVVVPDGGTVVVGGMKSKAAGGKATELLIIMTPHAVIPTPPMPTAVVPASGTTTDLTKY